MTQPTEVEPTPTPTNSQQVTIELSPTLEAIPGAIQLIAAAEAIMNIGADMTDQEREEAQAVVVSAIIVSQLAQVRKIK
jgi:formaldehyde-activating enzyme involved in methanogenesis